MEHDASVLRALTRTAPLHTRSEVLAHPSPVPREGGVYGWYFRRAPAGVPLDGCVEREGHVLLYLGISPSSLKGRATLRSRIRQHMRGSARRSTLRFTLGCLLADELGITLHPKDANGFWLAEGEARLSDWLEENAAVAWAAHPRPWEVEPDLIRSLSLPLNLQHNPHPFVERLRGIRAKARDTAKAPQPAFQDSAAHEGTVKTEIPT